MLPVAVTSAIIAAEEQRVTNRRETRRTNWRVRGAVGVRASGDRHQSEVMQLLERGDPDDFERIIELLRAEDEAAK